MSTDLAKAWINRTFETMQPSYRQSVVPIFAGSEVRASVAGTGTLFRIDDARFLVTAAHVVDARSDHTDLFLTSGVKGEKGIPLPDGGFKVPDPHDIAVVKLSDETVKSLGPRRFLCLADVDLTAKPVKPGYFHVFGYPLDSSRYEYSRAVVSLNPFLQLTKLYQGETLTLENYDPDHHMVLRVERMHAVSTDGEPASIPGSLAGISGSSLWQIHRQGEDPVTWSEGRARVVAVQTSQYKRSDAFLVRGTYWIWALKIIKEGWPELAPSIQVGLNSQLVPRL
jgi:hypothetical protein